MLSIGEESYTRRCRECWNTATYPVPAVRKKIVYIDQFAISNMMKALNDEMKSHQKAKADPFWLELFDALERVCKMQLVICPDSGAHRDESLMAPYFAALKRMYEQMSHGITFYDAAMITDAQIDMALLAWMRGKVPVYDLNPERVVHGQLNGWQDRLLITVEMKYPDDVVEGIRKFLDTVHEKVAKVFDSCRDRGENDFGAAFEHERQHGADAILIAASNYAARLREMLESGDLDFEKLEGFRSKGYDTFVMIREALLLSGTKPEEVVKQIQDFVDSDTYKHAASVAKRASNSATVRG